jgi:hypothetical protein
MKVVAGKIPMHVHDELIEWKAEHMPNATMSEVVRFSIEKQLSDDLVEITPQTLSGFLATVAERDELLSENKNLRERLHYLSYIGMGDKNREGLPDQEGIWV